MKDIHNTYTVSTSISTSICTKELDEELTRRRRVISASVGPYQDYEIKSKYGAMRLSAVAPATVLIIKEDTK
jgi:hypothetical protein